MWSTKSYILRNKKYSFIPILGWTRSKFTEYITLIPSKVTFPSAPFKCNLNIENVNEPYRIKETETVNSADSIDLPYCPSKLITLYAKLLIWLSSHCYPLLFIASFLRLNLFSNGKIASEIFRKIHPNNQNILCLARSIFIATTSRNFVSDGTLFIGAFLPTHSLHAWVMEKGQNVCSYDKYWTNYVPLSIMY